MKDITGVAAAVLPKAITSRPMYVDVETRGELTRGMSVIDARPKPAHLPNVEMVTDLDVPMVRDYMLGVLKNVGDVEE